MSKISGRQGQVAMEYVAVVIILVGALLAMQLYFKRGVQGRMKTSVDSIGEQYDPRTTETDITQRVQGVTTTTISVQDMGALGKETIRVDNSIMIENKGGTTRVDAY